jgi:hypothetical protein
MSVEFRFAREGEYPACSAFLHEHWANNHIYCRSEPLFDWTFQRPGFSKEGEYTMAVGEHGGELVGLLGGIPFTFNLRGESLAAIWLANYVIREDHRRGPTALKLLSMLRGDPYGATVAFGINPATAKIYQVLRGKVLPLIPRHFGLLPGNEERMTKLLGIAYPDRPEEGARELAAKVVIHPPQEPSAAVSQELPESWDETDWSKIAAETVGAARDRDFLSWRYAQHPLFDYNFIVAPEGGRNGLIVWRLETIKKATEDGGREDVEKIGRLVEFLPASEANGRELLAHFWKQVAAADAIGADYYGYHGPTRETLNALGFGMISEADSNAIPSRFQPLDGKGGGIMSAFFLKKDAPAVTIAADCPWYWTKADSDQDRPN